MAVAQTRDDARVPQLGSRRVWRLDTLPPTQHQAEPAGAARSFLSPDPAHDSVMVTMEAFIWIAVAGGIDAAAQQCCLMVPTYVRRCAPLCKVLTSCRMGRLTALSSSTTACQMETWTLALCTAEGEAVLLR